MKPLQSPIHILGTGNIGCLVASELALHVPPENIMLMLRSKEHCDRFLLHDRTIRIEKPVGKRVWNEQKVMAMYQPVATHTSYKPIDNLIVTTPAHATQSALERYIPSIGRDTTIVLLQNGMGVYEELCRAFWPNPDLRPSFVFGITTHGVHSYPKTPFSFKHVGQGYLKLAIVPRDLRIQGEEKLSESKRSRESEPDMPEENGANQATDSASQPLSLLQALSSSKSPEESLSQPSQSSLSSQSCALPEVVEALLRTSSTLSTQLVPYTDFVFDQHEKLIINACINPLTAVLHCTNGELVRLPNFYTMVRNIAKEGCFLVRPRIAEQVPSELGYMIHTRFNPDRMVSMVKHVCERTSRNKSSMLQQVLKLGNTEIDYINGYLVALGQQYRLPHAQNIAMVDLVKAKSDLERLSTEYEELET